jgi:hypothetical protein
MEQAAHHATATPLHTTATTSLNGMATPSTPLSHATIVAPVAVTTAVSGGKGNRTLTFAALNDASTSPLSPLSTHSNTNTNGNGIAHDSITIDNSNGSGLSSIRRRRSLRASSSTSSTPTSATSPVIDNEVHYVECPSLPTTSGPSVFLGIISSHYSR